MFESVMLPLPIYAFLAGYMVLLNHPLTFPKLVDMVLERIFQ